MAHRELAKPLGVLLAILTTLVKATGENASFGSVGCQRGWSNACPVIVVDADA